MSLRKGDHGRGSLLAPGGCAPWGQNRTAVRHLLILILKIGTNVGTNVGAHEVR